MPRIRTRFFGPNDSGIDATADLIMGPSLPRDEEQFMAEVLSYGFAIARVGVSLVDRAGVTP